MCVSSSNETKIKAVGILSHFVKITVSMNYLCPCWSKNCLSMCSMSSVNIKLQANVIVFSLVDVVSSANITDKLCLNTFIFKAPLLSLLHNFVDKLLVQITWLIKQIKSCSNINNETKCDNQGSKDSVQFELVICSVSIKQKQQHCVNLITHKSL